MTQKIYKNALELIGNTPLISLGRIRLPHGAEICGKLENFNPAGSVKDRPAMAMIDAAEKNGDLATGSTIVEATSGNTGISLAMIASVRGYDCVIVMPEDMSLSRRHILKAYGATVLLTPAQEGMAGAVKKAEQVADEKKGAFIPSQFENEANPEIHAKTTAKEILHDTDGDLDVFVTGVGTGGTLTGVGRILKKHNPNIKVIAVEPKSSAILSGGKPGLHGIQGLGAGFIPNVLDQNIIDEIITVSDLAADRMALRLCKEEALFVGPSAGANVHAALEVSSKLNPEQRVVTILCDGGERYLC